MSIKPTGRSSGPSRCLHFYPRSVLPILVLSSIPVQAAFAYLDPGTGSMILQGIIAALAVAGLTLRHYWHRLLGLFGRSPSQRLQDSSSKEQHDNDPDR